ncbi:MAG: (2Fe-2S)-binding protein [Bacteriovoracaceae bacterium]|jgi:bacterioferritin-associated ferredoxin|nr:(2Fe-2S)-binding protein [Bacteriovoracaceae bacterium]
MYVCICKGISEKDIERAMITHQNTKDILKSLGVGSDCGTCMIDAIESIKSKQKAHNTSRQTVQKPTNLK